MHFYSEAPITSFFPRITASKKRKIHTELSPSGSVSNKRQEGHTSATSIQGKSKAKEDEQERRNTLDNGTITILQSPSVDDLSTTRPTTRQQASERHIPLPPSSNAKNSTPQTSKPIGLPSRKKRKTSLQTPPPTNEGAERQLLMELTPTLSPFIFRTSPDIRIDKVLLPTPSTLGRSASQHNGHSSNDRSRDVQEQDSSSPTWLRHLDMSLKASAPVSVPSSQSQLMANGYFEDKHHLTSAQLPQYEVQLTLQNKISLNRKDKGESTSYASQKFISSSQSQFLSPFDEHDHPQKSQPSPIASNPELDIIPSSQSQERELRISSDPKKCHQSISSRIDALPQPTHLDEVFSVSILQRGWSDSSLDPEHPVQGIACVANHGDDSVTEPETEEKDSSYWDHRFALMQSQAYGFSQLSAVDLPSLNEDSQYKDSPSSDQSSQYLSLADQTFASLPSPVKEFQSMFGSDESYPPDFPMSLR